MGLKANEKYFEAKNIRIFYFKSKTGLTYKVNLN